MPQYHMPQGSRALSAPSPHTLHPIYLQLPQQERSGSLSHRADGSWAKPLPGHTPCCLFLHTSLPPSSLSSSPPSQPRTPRCSSMEISGSGLLTTGLLTPPPPDYTFCLWHIRMAMGKSDHCPFGLVHTKADCHLACSWPSATSVLCL